MCDPIRDHRPRVNAERRARTRQRLLEAAMQVFADKGIEGSQIDDVMKAAQVSRGGFYGHFRAMPELLTAVITELGNQIMAAIEQRVVTIADPAQRIASGLLLYLNCVRAFPQYARFVAAAGANVVGRRSLVFIVLPPHVREGNTKGQLSVQDVGAAVDLVAGAMLAAVMRLAQGAATPAYDANIVAGILLSLGVPRARAHKLSRLEVGQLEMAADSLLMRTHGKAISAPHQPS